MGLTEPLPRVVHVHHMDADKRNCCPCNLVALPCAFNPAHAKQHPVTGRMISYREWLIITGQWYGSAYHIQALTDSEQAILNEVPF